jgi:hypothetical protein
MAKQRFEKERQIRVFSRVYAGGDRDSAAARPLLSAFLVSKPPASPNDTIQAQVERLTAEAKKLNGAGKEARALDTYRKAAELMPGAPWLQHRTAELARKLKKPGVAAQHYRRAGAAFIGAGFPKRALAPLRNAWALSLATLPADASSFMEITLDLAELQRELGFPADGAVSIASANEALRAAGCSEQVTAPTEPRGSDKPLRASDPGLPPESGVVPSQQTAALGILARLRAAMKP